MDLDTAALLLLSALCTVSADRVIGGVGGTVTLPCHMRRDLLEAAHHSKFPATSIHWKRYNRTVVRVTPGGITYTVQSAISRAAVPQSAIQSGVFSLQLKNVKEEDSGIYQGTAHYGDSKLVCTVTLRTMKVSQSQSGLLPENGAVILTCAVNDPKKSHPYSYHWSRGGASIFQLDRISKSGPTLYIRRLSQADRGEWTCEVEGGRASLTLRVLGVSGPPRISRYSAVGSQVTLPCDVTEVPAEWPLTVQWSKDSDSIRGDNQVLTLPHVTPEDAATYRCDVTYRGQLMSRSITLKVIQVFPPGPTFAKEGSSLRLACNVTGAAEGELYDWTGPLNSTRHQDVIKGAQLNLPAVHREDSGIWVCSVHGKNGILGKAEHWLYVHAAQTAEFGSLSSWQTYIVFLLCLFLILGLMVIAGISIQNRRRRRSHLAILATLPRLPTPPQKTISVDD
ncbi:basement membrane-specific heparan sulfate proteoglycan core protein-like [Rana temporaria]|uniref:basement membrane-specific heparan sulfate proteoglycan core protein-like n=1 Tax=Rana temporaria TaxID=8407 RepID=UPI001AAC9CDF|nr:basement membrane-specific heparan sulfate proteoglycan core protein-like [Rana temporaria]